MVLLIILLVLIVIAAIYVISVYNGLQTLKTRIEASIQEIGNQLKRQSSLIPNLQETVKGYAAHEEKIYSQITEARKLSAQVNAKDLASVEKLETSLQQLSQGLRIIMESNPQLQANVNFQKLMSELSDTADKIMYARRVLINLTQNYNQKLVTFPSNIVANMFHFTKMAGLKTGEMTEALSVSDQEAKDVKVKFD